MKRFMFSLAALGLLAGCGIPGGLERPGPMWNSAEAIRRECDRAIARGERLDPRCEVEPPVEEPAPATTPTPLPQQPQISPAQ